MQLSTTNDTKSTAAPVNLASVRVSVFANAFAKTPMRESLLTEVLNDIKTGVYAERVALLRGLLAKQDEEGYEEKKRLLPAFTLSGTVGKRKGGEMSEPSGLLQVDLDDLDGDLEAVRAQVSTDPHVYFGFTSPSGAGLKLGLLVSGGSHSESFQMAERYFLERYNVAIDPLVKAINNLCFVSHDPLLWINPGVTPLTNLNLSTSADFSPPLPTSGKCPTIDVEEEIEKAIAASIPSGKSQNHRRLFELAWAVKGIEKQSGVAFTDHQLRSICRRWFDRAKPFTRHEFDEYRYEFLEALEDVKYPKGAKVLAEAWERAKQATPHPKVIEIVESQKIRLLASLCYELQLLAGDEPFFLLVRQVQRLFKHDNHRTPNNWLNGLCRDGILKKVKQGNSHLRERSEYRWGLGDPPSAELTEITKTDL